MLALVGAITLAAGCSAETETIFVRSSLPIPARPSLPVVAPAHLDCLSAAAYEALVTRDAMLQAHIRRLEAIMSTTNDTAGRR